MTDQAAQHGPRLDDELKSEVGTIAPGPIHREPERYDDVLERSQIARFLRPSALPAPRSTILTIARDEHAPDAVLDELGRLPDGVDFATVGELWVRLGHETEHRESPPTVDDAPVAEVMEDLLDTLGADPRLGPSVLLPESGPASGEVRDRGRGLRPLRHAIAAGLGVVQGVVRIADDTLAEIRRRLTE